jgi:cytochrome c biogenesis protein CcmG/thiol:disulfide interchange protein DsbE
VIIGSPLLDKPAPDFELATLDGRRVHLSDYRGKPVIVNFWASWCIPCRDEFPLFVSTRQTHAAAGLEILGIVHQDSSDAAGAFARQMGGNWPLLLDPDQIAWKAYQGLGVPSTYFIDRQGVVRATSLGPVLASALPGQLAKIL